MIRKAYGSNRTFNQPAVNRPHTAVQHSEEAIVLSSDCDYSLAEFRQQSHQTGNQLPQQERASFYATPHNTESHSVGYRRLRSTRFLITARTVNSSNYSYKFAGRLVSVEANCYWALTPARKLVPDKPKKMCFTTSRCPTWDSLTAQLCVTL